MLVSTVGGHGRVGAQPGDGREVFLHDAAPALEFVQSLGRDRLAHGDEAADARPLASGELAGHEDVGLDVAVVLDDEFVGVLRQEKRGAEDLLGPDEAGLRVEPVLHQRLRGGLLAQERVVDLHALAVADAAGFEQPGVRRR